MLADEDREEPRDTLPGGPTVGFCRLVGRSGRENRRSGMTRWRMVAGCSTPEKTQYLGLFRRVPSHSSEILRGQIYLGRAKLTADHTKNNS